MILRPRDRQPGVEAAAVRRITEKPPGGGFRTYASLRAIYAADSSTLSSSSPVKAAGAASSRMGVTLLVFEL
jgi:hypothetical protein